MVDVLAIGPHPDDVELGMGATLVHLLGEDYGVGIVDLTDGEPTPFGTPEIRRQESAEAAKILGVNFRATLDMKNRWLFDTVENRIKLAEVIREQRPEIVFIPYWDDSHPDHVIGSALCMSAIFTARLTKTDMIGEPHRVRRVFHFNSIHLKTIARPAFIVDVSAGMEKKIAAMRAYKSQFGMTETSKGVIERICAMNRYLGSMIGAQYGEGFFVKEELGVRSMRGII